MVAPNFTDTSRLLLVAPHPDDESLACGVMLQRAVRAGAAVRVVYATDGEDNPWPQRFLDKKWRLSASDRKRWGKMRRTEALAALRTLGVPARAARFLSLPDQKLTALLLHGGNGALDRLTTILEAFQPTHVLIPSISDTHPDHSALAVMFRFVFDDCRLNWKGTSVWSYVVHGRTRAFFDWAYRVRSSSRETAAKIRAIRCHQSQLRLSKRRFLTYARRPERFCQLGLGDVPAVEGSISGISRRADSLHVQFKFLSTMLIPSARRLFICCQNGAGDLQSSSLELPTCSALVEVLDCGSTQCLGLAEYRGNSFEGELALPLNLFSRIELSFIKLERRTWFFDEAGWIALPSSFIHAAPVEARPSIEHAIAIR